MSGSTMRNVLVFLAGLVLGTGVTVARAALTIEEVYSNFDGSIQFIVLNRTGDPLSSLVGRTLVATDGVTTNRFTFAADVPADRNHPAVLLATQPFASLGKIAPDVIVPDHFLALANGSVSIDASTFDYTGSRLPDDGWHARYRDLSAGGSGAFVAAAANSAGDAYSFTREPTLTGLWWNAAQPGWGLAVAQQDNLLFALWATHDADGSPTWFSVSATPVVCGDFDVDCANLIAGGYCDAEIVFDVDCSNAISALWAGALYRGSTATGANSADAAKVVDSQVGTIRIQFPSSPVEGRFQFTIGDKSGQRSLAQAVFASPIRQCFASTAVVPGSSNHQGLWSSPAAPDWLQLDHQDQIVFAIWFTYDHAGRATWYTFAALRTSDDAYAGTIYRTTGAAFDVAPDASPALNAAVGTASLAFGDAGHGTFTYDIDGTSATKAIERKQLGGVAPICD